MGPDEEELDRRPIAQIARAYADGARTDPAGARATAVAALVDLVKREPAAADAPAALRMLGRFLGVPEEAARAPAVWRDLASRLPDGPTRAAAAGAWVRALCDLERWEEGRAAAREAEPWAGPDAGRVPFGQVVATAEIRSKLKPGREPPPLEAKALDGRTLSIRALRGRVVLVEFGTTANPDWAAEFPHRLAVHQAARERGFEVLSVSLDGDPARLRDWLADRKVPWPTACDGKGPDGPAPRAWAVTGTCSFLLDRKGVVRHADLRGRAALEKAVEALLAEPPPPRKDNGEK
ncbi:MAG: TlpA family protein disulfide reductase [Planctomycetales bacterium]|nr:TlpA family protein disulfide reductase [Planctomycetales bacterium]